MPLLFKLKSMLRQNINIMEKWELVQLGNSFRNTFFFDLKCEKARNQRSPLYKTHTHCPALPQRLVRPEAFEDIWQVSWSDINVIRGSLEGFFCCCWLKLSEWFYTEKKKKRSLSNVPAVQKEDSYPVLNWKWHWVEHRDLEVAKPTELHFQIWLSNPEPTYIVLCKVSPASSVTDFFTKY